MRTLHTRLRRQMGYTVSGNKPFYLLGDVDPSKAIFAYQPFGAASLAASYVNLITPGTNDAAPGTAPNFDASYGWDFVSASNHYLNVGSSSPIPNAPISVLVLFKSDVNDVDDGLFTNCDAAANTSVELVVKGTVASDPVYATAWQSGNSTNSSAITTTGITVGQWHVACGVFTSNVSRSAYLDGGSKNNNTTTKNGNGADNMSIGCRREPGLNNCFDGKIGAVCGYNVALTDTQVSVISAAMLALVA